MQKVFIAVVALMSFMPVVAQASVVTADDIQRLTIDAQRQNDGCKLVDFALNTQGNMSDLPTWKNLNLPNGVVLRMPWSPMWRLVGKQIPWFEKKSDTSYEVGPFQGGDGCGLYRKYILEIATNKTIAQRFAKPHEGDAEGVIDERMTLNGKKIALISHPLGMCEQQSVAVEVKRAKKIHTIVVTHRCGAIDGNMMRMVAGMK